MVIYVKREDTYKEFVTFDTDKKIYHTNTSNILQCDTRIFVAQVRDVVKLREDLDRMGYKKVGKEEFLNTATEAETGLTFTEYAAKVMQDRENARRAELLANKDFEIKWYTEHLLENYVCDEDTARKAAEDVFRLRYEKDTHWLDAILEITEKYELIEKEAAV